MGDLVGDTMVVTSRCSFFTVHIIRTDVLVRIINAFVLTFFVSGRAGNFG